MPLQKFNIDKLIKFLSMNKHDDWVNILATHAVFQGYNHIVEHNEFSEYTLLEEDILEDVSFCEIGALYEYSLSYYDYDYKKNSGVFYTPEDVALVMGEFHHDFPSGVWLDPCCGTGNLIYGIVSCNDDPKTFLEDSIVACDIDETALLIARTILSIKFGDENTFDKIKNNFIKADFIQDDINLDYHFVIMNPPYVSGVKKAGYATSSCKDVYALFIEKALSTSDGIISITPQSFTHSQKFMPLRKFLLNSTKMTIHNFDNIPDTIFKGVKFGSINTNKNNSVRASIMVASPVYTTNKITSLLKWTSKQREQLLADFQHDLSTVELHDDIFPKVGKAHEHIYQSVCTTDPISHCISKNPTDYVLYVPSTPRYFITASRTHLQRSSMKIMYCSNKESYDYLYVLLNSAYFYWWWRVMDGGMTLSLDTIKSCPAVPVVDGNIEYIVEKLERSEKTHKIISKNGGKVQENIKHSSDLVRQATGLFFSSKNTELLMNTTLNSSMIFLQ